MPLTTSTTRAAALMPLCVYFHCSPGSYCIGAASQSGTRSASVLACCAAGPVASPRPDVWVRIWVIVRFAGLPEGVFKSANSRRYFATGSATVSLPSSCSMRIATPVTGLVIEAIQNRVSGVIGRFAATSAKPVASRWSTLSFETTTVTAPATSFFAIIPCMAVPIPGSVGSAAKVVRVAASANMTGRRHRLMAKTCSCFVLRSSSRVAWEEASRVHRFLDAVALAVLIWSAGAAAAQGTLPAAEQPVLPDLTIIAPAAPGGGWDQLAREMQREIERQRLAAAVQVENVPGAAGTIGLAQLINGRRGDGEALLVNGLVMLGAILWNQSPVSITQVTPIARLTGEYEIVAVPAASPHRDMQSLVARAPRESGGGVLGRRLGRRHRPHPCRPDRRGRRRRSATDQLHRVFRRRRSGDGAHRRTGDGRHQRLQRVRPAHRVGPPPGHRHFRAQASWPVSTCRR